MALQPPGHEPQLSPGLSAWLTRLVREVNALDAEVRGRADIEQRIAGRTDAAANAIRQQIAADSIAAEQAAAGVRSALDELTAGRVADRESAERLVSGLEDRVADLERGVSEVRRRVSVLDREVAGVSTAPARQATAGRLTRSILLDYFTFRNSVVNTIVYRGVNYLGVPTDFTYRIISNEVIEAGSDRGFATPEGFHPGHSPDYVTRTITRRIPPPDTGGDAGGPVDVSFSAEYVIRRTLFDPPIGVSDARVRLELQDENGNPLAVPVYTGSTITGFDSPSLFTGTASMLMFGDAVQLAFWRNVRQGGFTATFTSTLEGNVPVTFSQPSNEDRGWTVSAYTSDPITLDSNVPPPGPAITGVTRRDLASRVTVRFGFPNVTDGFLNLFRVTQGALASFNAYVDGNVVPKNPLNDERFVFTEPWPQGYNVWIADAVGIVPHRIALYLDPY